MQVAELGSGDMLHVASQHPSKQLGEAAALCRISQQRLQPGRPELWLLVAVACAFQ